MKNKPADACKGCGVGGTFDIDGERVVPGPSPSLRCGTSSPMARTTNSLPKCRTGSQTLSYPKWCALLVSNVLKTRTSFASFLNKSIFLSQAKSRLGMAPTFFPIPVPPGEHFDRMPASTSQHKRRMVHLKRAIHTICMAMNFWYGGGKFSDMELLQREPNNQHRCFYGRLAALIRSDGLAESFTVAKSGRRFPNLIARLSELSTVLTKQGGFDPYSKTFAGADVELDEEAVNSLNPYRDLDPSRLVLHGTGTWDATSFLSDDLVMAYREPRVLLSGIDAGVRPAIRDAVATVGELAKRWDKNGLLLVHDEPVNPDSFVKIFNCFKSAALDRQIGDRRGQNSLESRLEGPSRDLPSGSDMQDIVANPKTHKLCLSVTDRRDFYHQLAATRSRAISNTVGPGVPWSMVAETKGYENFLMRTSMVRKQAREAKGDFLAGLPLHVTTPIQRLVKFGYPLLQCFKVITVVWRSALMPIDDYFCISKELTGTPNQDSVAYARYAAAQRAYEDNNLLGSPAKDVLAENEGKAIGASINSSSRARDRGLITLAASAEKRLSLSFLTLQACALSHTTDSLHLCIVGGWVSLLSYRRPLMSIMNKVFHLVDGTSYDPNEPKIIALTRPVADELVLLSVLVPLALHEISAGYDPTIYATDASDTMGGICSARVGEDVAEILWRQCKSKGAYTRLLTSAEVLLRRLELHEEGRAGREAEAVPRPLAFSFYFIEIFAGSAKVTSFVEKMGVSVGPPVELSLSEEFDVSNWWVLRWLAHLICNRLVKCFAIEPPCTTFSIMRRPRLRSRFCPLGFQVDDPHTANGNMLACRAGQTCFLAARYKVTALWETPFSSYMRHLPAWKAVSRLPQTAEVRCDSCRFGSPHLKSFRFLCIHANPRPLMLRCTCVGKHVQIQGSYTKESAVYVDGLARALASVLVESARAIDRSEEEELALEVRGLENQLVNEVAICAPWKVESSWSFRKHSHINILEEAALLESAWEA